MISDRTEVRMVTLLESDLPKLIMVGHASPKTSYSVRVDGPVSSKELRNIIRMIELQAVFLEDGEREAEARLESLKVQKP